MHLNQVSIFLSQKMIKTIVLSMAVATTAAIVTGCASKPQIHGGTRFAQAPNYYTVKSGDTLSKIAAKYYGSAGKYHAIFEANKPMLSNPDKIYPGQSLRIPGAMATA